MLTVQSGFSACACVCPGAAGTLFMESKRCLRCEHEQDSVNKTFTNHSAHALDDSSSNVSEVLRLINMMKAKDLHKCRVHAFRMETGAICWSL